MFQAKCNDCKSDIVFHADMSFECACERMEGDSENIPACWEVTVEEIRLVRDEEREHSENE
jgi:hypothetical protein